MSNRVSTALLGLLALPTACGQRDVERVGASNNAAGSSMDEADPGTTSPSQVMAGTADTTAVPPASDEGMPDDLGLATGGPAGAGGSSGGGDAGRVGAAGMGDGGGAMTTLCTPARPRDPGPTTLTVQSGGTNRSYILHIPPGYDGTAPVPLVFDIHGFTSWAEEQLQRSKWDEMADEEGFVVIAPDGVNQSWNAGNCCGGNGQDDVQFFRDMVEKARLELCIDSSRVYVSGHSNGGAMAYRLACEAADLFAAVNPVCASMGMSVDPCNPSRPIPVLATRATGDGAVTIDSADGDIDEWLSNNEGDESAMTTSGGCKTYTSCSTGTQVMDCRPGGGHGFYYASGSGNPDNYLVPDNAWLFFQQFSLP